MKNFLVAVAVTLTVQTLAAMAMIAPSVLAPVAAPELGVPPQAIGIFVSIVYIGAMLSGLLTGRLVARLGALTVCQAALVIIGIGLALGRPAASALVPVAAFAIGVGYGVVTPASSHVLARHTPEGRMSLVFSIKQTGVPIGGAIAGVVVPALVGALGWTEALAVLGAACVVTAIALLLARGALAERTVAAGARRTLRGELHALQTPIRLVLSHGALREMAFASLGYAAVQIVFTSYFVSYLDLVLGYSLVTAGFTYALAHGAGVAGRILWGAVADRWVAPRLMLGILGLVAAACNIATATFSGAWPFAGVVAVAVLSGASAVSWNGVYLAEVARCAPPGHVGTATGGTQFFTFIGAFAGPPLFAAAVWATGSYAPGFALFALPSLVVGVQLFRPRAAGIR